MSLRKSAEKEVFELAMRQMGHRNFEQENGRYCLQVLNDLLLAFKAGRESVSQ